ncbi:MAG: hypothetical protein PWQ59_82 [Thermoanaerobacterium sp.]|nr:hypothetical protein [Thermoanaerobacterium sp.]MDN5317208.1 hypothetical protein [Thermoanaerobacterium sp.]
MFRIEESETYKMIIEKGMQKGIEKGIKKGAQQERIAIAKEMLSEGISIKKIAKITKLSVEEIKKLIN